MSRDIKFRIWSNRVKLFLDIKYCTMSMDGQYVDVCGDKYNTWDEVTLMQFTGLKDKNGKEIYEGDIVKMPLYGNTIISWNDFVCAFQYEYFAVGKGTATGGRMTNTIYKSDVEKKFEVIGNIYENPELLK
jgi:uncharacterized phage protein (TIGR01671 family)